jgi:hypothetical protein
VPFQRRTCRGGKAVDVATSTSDRAAPEGPIPVSSMRAAHNASITCWMALTKNASLHSRNTRAELANGPARAYEMLRDAQKEVDRVAAERPKDLGRVWRTRTWPVYPLVVGVDAWPSRWRQRAAAPVPRGCWLAPPADCLRFDVCGLKPPRARTCSVGPDGGDRYMVLWPFGTSSSPGS